MDEPYISIKSYILKTIEQELPCLRKSYDIAEIGIFGSVSQGEDTPESDIDILYTFQPGKATCQPCNPSQPYRPA
ncbi:nucleotidyltransferase family protein [Methanocorpusculum vombati]|uniref:Nucleotidyltransferase domain-containing protein n=1 Tax=Methanocorpusculum vombati TaxID=3002864 RepID=A0ABT4ILJ4_9EURY|nr:nucleotidyltransferase domain-containing protein [Methanocorpusculum vombati]MCZ0862411.1 nucleotidyltransferase domain-containing protein [Methanocorpusculum vombati]MCZ9319406.1 nucleotidyltransferase domain-containing protein [Methanocorpusculum sp.]MDE2534267.1 nucleotidyltransferase domain-containing protein [Methanocorpusculum sp.]MDE2548859.1 nucleotidyltransferase domain-containing protein [Methanocorpusculum sp.]